MKKIGFVSASIILALAAAGNAYAASSSAGPTAGGIGLSADFAPSNSPIDTSFFVSGKYFISKSMAIIAGAGLRLNDSGAPTNAKSTDYGIQGGFRYYLKTDELAPFVGGRLTYGAVRTGAGGAAVDNSILALGAEVGAEYFFSQHFSVEGAINLGYTSIDQKPLAVGATSTKATVFGTSMPSVRATFYW